MNLLNLFLYFCFFNYVAANSLLIYDPEDGKLNFTQLAEKYGQICEEFDVITEDGYILKLFHIKGDSTRPVLLAHGNADTSDTYILRGKQSMVIALAEQGYDLWFLNFRGNRYSRRHVKLNPDKDREFWDFSYHEIGMKDLPANIDFILEKTNQTQLSYIGHSQGTQISFVLTSMKCEYNNKLKVIIAMAPIAYVSHLPDAGPRAIMLWPAISAYLNETGQDELYYDGKSLTRGAYEIFCSLKGIGYDICVKGFWHFQFGSQACYMDPEFCSVVVRHYPSSTTRKNFDHLAQNANAMRFAPFDYGPSENLIRYGSTVSPEYPLENITTRVILLVGQADRLSDVKDCEILKNKLSNVVFHEMQRTDFGHVDFLWANDMETMLFPIIYMYLL